MSTELTPVEHVLTGTPGQVKAVILNAHQRGRLVGRPGPARPVGRGMVRVDVVLLEPAQRLSNGRILSRRTRVTLTVSAAVLGALAVLGYLLAVAVAWIVAHAAVLIGSGVVLLLAAGALGRLARGGSAGGHSGMGWHYTRCGK